METLDLYGSMAGWKEEDAEAQDKSELDVIQRYQKIRKFVEITTGRPIPWVPEAPYVAITPVEREQQKKEARKIRTQIYTAIRELKRNIDPLKAKGGDEYNRAFLIGLYSFVSAENYENKLRGVAVEKIPPEIWSIPELSEFITYLDHRGGLGMWNTQGDAEEEGTVLQTISGYVELKMGNIIKKGWCTEKAKVLYGVLHMAGFRAFFVEPLLPIDYFVKTNRLGNLEIPLPGHMASGVAVTLKNQKGKEEIWIMDMAMGMVHADYTDYPHWQLSLRHYWMADLSNLGVDQMRLGKVATKNYEAAQKSFELALRLGRDSTAFHAMANYATLLGNKPEWVPPSVNVTAEYLTKKASQIHPLDSTIQHHLGLYYGNKGQLKEALKNFTKTIDIDPRDTDYFQDVGKILKRASESKKPKEKRKFKMLLAYFKVEIGKIKKGHPLFKNEIEKGLEIVKQAIGIEQ